MIKDVLLTPLDIIEVPNGRVFHALKDLDEGYNKFGEAYFSEVEPGKVKAWKRHQLMTLNLVVPIGEIRFVLFDDRLEGHQEYGEYYLSPQRYSRLTIPPMVWVGFQGLSKTNSLLLNVADLTHDPEEVDRKELSEIQFDWSK
jgi:dTDP-4-dehydrorhamnose 3,5-epimerase